MMAQEKLDWIYENAVLFAKWIQEGRDPRLLMSLVETSRSFLAEHGLRLGK